MNERQTPAFWMDRIKAWQAHVDREMHQYRKYARWFEGDSTDLYTAATEGLHVDSNGELPGNMMGLVVRQSRAQLMYRAPQFLVKPPPTLSTRIFTSDLARTETLLLNDSMQEDDLFNEGRRTLLDGLLGPLMVFKLGYGFKSAVDHEKFEAQTKHAEAEGLEILQGGRPALDKKNDDHEIHIDVHESMLALHDRGDLELEEPQLKWLKAHLKNHRKEAKTQGVRPTENIRNQHVWARRVHPEAYFEDPWAEREGDIEWRGEMFMKTVREAKANKKYDQTAVSEIRPMQSKRYPRSEEAGMDSYAVGGSEAQSGFPDEEMWLGYEVIDLVEGKVITFAQDGGTPLLVEEYTWSDILPSGPYVRENGFAESPISCRGIPQPTAYEYHQICATRLMLIIAETADKMVPGVFVDAQAISDENEAKRLQEGDIGGVTFLRGLGQKKVQDIAGAKPVPELSSQLFEALSLHLRMIERLSGLGAARLAGGDRSGTATASAIVSESTTTMAEDMAAVFDNFMQRMARAKLRLMRRYYTPRTVAELVGADDALGKIEANPMNGGIVSAPVIWPEAWSTRDIRNDRGVSVVPGSAQRNTSETYKRQLVEAAGLLLQMPTLPPEAAEELVQQILRAVGIEHIDLSGMKEAVLAKMANEQAAAEGGPEPGARVPRRAEGGERSEGSRSSVGQAQNSPNSNRTPPTSRQGVNATRKKALSGSK